MLKNLPLFVAGFLLIASGALAQVVQFTNPLGASLPSNVVTGSGTAGQVGYWGASQSLAGSVGLVYDPTNTRLGIGVINPSTTLHVSGSSIFTGDITAQRFISTGPTSTNLPSFETSSRTGLYSTNSQSVGITTNGTRVFNVGPSNIHLLRDTWVGAASGIFTPSTTLHVSGTVRINALSGTGTAYVCVDEWGSLTRSSSPCV